MLLGVMGWVLIEDFSFSEAFYMTIIAASSVGFGEVHCFSSGGQWFTTFLIMGSFGTFACGLNALRQILISGELALEFKKRNLDKAIHKISNPLIIYGFGRNGGRAYQKLKADSQDVLLIEKDQKIEQHLLEGSILFLEGNATADVIVEQARVPHLRVEVSTLSKDADNLFVITSSRNLNKDNRLTSRASCESTEKKLQVVGADSVIMPADVGVGHLNSLVGNPATIEFLEHLSVEANSAINLKEKALSELIGDANSKTTNDLEIRKKGLYRNWDKGFTRRISC